MKKRTWNGKDYTKVFVLCDSKNDQDFKLFIYDYDECFLAPYNGRMEEVKFYKNRVLQEHKMPKRCKDCTDCNCKKAMECNMRNACWNVGFGRIRL